MSYPDALWDDTGEVSAARTHRYLTETLMQASRPYSTAPPRLSDEDVQRIAEAVVDEQERRASHPLQVTAADVRRWIR